MFRTGWSANGWTQRLPEKDNSALIHWLRQHRLQCSAATSSDRLLNRLTVFASRRIAAPWQATISRFRSSADPKDSRLSLPRPTEQVHAFGMNAPKRFTTTADAVVWLTAKCCFRPEQRLFSRTARGCGMRSSGWRVARTPSSPVKSILPFRTSLMPTPERNCF
jgi:hypothetical protein